jgi:hypothetical protein
VSCHSELGGHSLATATKRSDNIVRKVFAYLQQSCFVSLNLGIIQSSFAILQHHAQLASVLIQNIRNQPDAAFLPSCGTRGSPLILLVLTQSFASTSAPFAINSSATAVCPLKHAFMNGVLLYYTNLMVRASCNSGMATPTATGILMPPIQTGTLHIILHT